MNLSYIYREMKLTKGEKNKKLKLKLALYPFVT